MYDIAIIGSGPAGLSAAVNGISRNKKVVVFGRGEESSWIYKAEKVNNYLGVYDLNGQEMIKKFYDHALSLGVEIKKGRVLQIMPMGNYFSINMENEFYESKTIILAIGIEKGKKVKGEDEYLGKGVSYCATCDGMLYKNKTAVVVGEIEEAEEDANFLSGICKKVYFVPKYKKDKYSLNSNVEIVKDEVKEVFGNEFVQGLSFNKNKIECEGAFFIKDSMPVSNLVYGLKTEKNSIVINRLCETNIAGLFAAGDCTGWPYQVSKAVGEGLISAQQAARYIDEMEKSKIV